MPSHMATVLMERWKEQECFECGGSFRYRCSRRVSIRADTLAEAEATAGKLALEKIRASVEDIPCPQCGALQPSMVGRRRFRRHLLLSILGLVAGALAFLLGLIPPGDFVPYSALTGVLTVATVAVVVGHAVAAGADPNRSAEVNLVEANRLRAASRLEPVGTRAEVPPRAEWPKPDRRWLLLVVPGVLAVASLPVLLLATGWVSNDRIRPEVCAPGDTVRVNFGTTIKSVGARWSGSSLTAVAEVRGQTIPLVATTNRDTWGNQLMVRKGDGNLPAHLWADIELPKDDGLVGQTIQVRLRMTVSSPYTVVGSGQFSTTGQDVSVERPITFSSPGAGTWYVAACSAAVAGVLFVAAGGVLLCLAASGLRRLSPMVNLVERPQGTETGSVPPPASGVLPPTPGAPPWTGAPDRPSSGGWRK